ncbi:KxYKxGKxW signal peptide domain-containing protein [Weissella confusa]|uniref:KxYKxGKxW signal peptide domain-containing protein n=1 Tax=Weissella confusa TaxID=1583 RepID=UPI0018F1BD26|nr:KxYKxGKxW signal peptide domain-containing protein [Weissella confusa]MBJ7629210.1 KxYKxGKxW signal peptide domain-containing protein [Weissella confusa]
MFKKTQNETGRTVRFKMYKDGKKWVTRGLSIMGVALIVGAPVMTAGVQLSSIQAVQAATDSADYFSQVPQSVLDAAKNNAVVDLSNNQEFSDWLVSVARNWYNYGYQQAAIKALGDFGAALAANGNLTTVNLSGVFKAANAQDSMISAQMFWYMKLPNIKTVSFVTLNLSNNNFDNNLVTQMHPDMGLERNDTVKTIDLSGNDQQMISNIQNPNYVHWTGQDNHGVGGYFTAEVNPDGTPKTGNSGDDSQTGDNTNPGGAGNNGDDNQTGDSTNPGGAGNNGDDSQTGDNTNNGGAGNNGDNTNNGGAGNNGDDSQTGDNTNPGGAGNNGDGNQNGGSTNPGGAGNNGDGNQTGDGTNNGGAGNNGDDSQAGDNTNPGGAGNNGEDNQTGDSTNPGGAGNNGEDNQTGDSTNPGGAGNNGEDNQTGDSTNPGGAGNNGDDNQTGDNTNQLVTNNVAQRNVNVGNDARVGGVTVSSLPNANVTGGQVATSIATTTTAAGTATSGSTTGATTAGNATTPASGSVVATPVSAGAAQIQDSEFGLNHAKSSLHDTQFKSDKSGLIASIMSAIVGGLLALFLVFWRRRKETEEEMNERLGLNNDDALLSEVDKLKDSWK